MTMLSSIKIFFPELPSNSSELCFKGYITERISKSLTIFITKISYRKDLIKQNTNRDDEIYGCSSNYRHRSNYRCGTTSNILTINIDNGDVEFSKLYLMGRKIPVNDSTIMLYGYSAVKESETLHDSLDQFSKLQSLIHYDCGWAKDQALANPQTNPHTWLSSSMLCQHVLNYINLCDWFNNNFRRSHMINIKQGNLLLAVVIDVILGYMVLELLALDTYNASAVLMGVLEKLANLLYSMLKWLMGAPAGLKLNKAFNRMLGQYFTYHIQCWWLFLDVSGDKLSLVLHIFQYVGYLGITFQAAMISDMISIATFHLYMIYVFAARLYNLQILGLLALLRLFVGRKFNPLRKTIDSCEYTNQELFVGTVAFTILLLLLPTTTMYYIVFILLRLLTVVVQYLLVKLIYCIQTLPLYVATLWATGSPKVAGNILIEVVNKDKPSPSVLRIKLNSTPLRELACKFKPPVITPPKQFEWSNLIPNLVTGKQFF